MILKLQRYVSVKWVVHLYCGTNTFAYGGNCIICEEYRESISSNISASETTSEKFVYMQTQMVVCFSIKQKSHIPRIRIW